MVVRYKWYLSQTGLGAHAGGWENTGLGPKPPLRPLFLWNNIHHIPNVLQSCGVQPMHELRAVYTMLGKQCGASVNILNKRPQFHPAQIFFPCKALNMELTFLWPPTTCCLYFSSGKKLWRASSHRVNYLPLFFFFNIMCFYLIL